MVVKLILSQGLVEYKNNEAELHRRAIAAYRAFRKANASTVWRIEKPFRFLRDLIARTQYDFPRVTVTKIKFLGLWDTVAAYGLPFEEMTRFYSRWIFPFEILDGNLHPDVARACHALSVDDERTTFHPQLWTEKDETKIAGKDTRIEFTNQERISQVWFAGVHSNVGGGYPDDSLAQVSLSWIMDEATKCELRFKKAPTAEPDARLAVKSAADKDGRLYDSRAGLGAYYRYGPRDIFELCNNPDSGVQIELPKIHHTVFDRVLSGATPYAPIGLPARYAVVNAEGRVLTQDAGYEKSEQSERRLRHQILIWDSVWKRRLTYFATLLASAFLLLFPFFHRLPPSAETTSPLRPISDLVRLVGAFIPADLGGFWIEGYARNPSWFLIGMTALISCFLLSSRIEAKIADDMRLIWKASLSGTLSEAATTSWATYIRTNPLYVRLRQTLQSFLIPALSALLLIYVFSTVTSHILFNFFDADGYICVEADSHSLRHLQVNETVDNITFRPSALCQNTGIALEENAVYLIQFDSTATFRDGSIDASRGYTWLEVAQWHERIAKLLLVPLRREWFRPWFRVVARIGGRGSEETFLDPDFTDQHWIDEKIHATREGELFLFVNDTVIGVPGSN